MDDDDLPAPRTSDDTSFGAELGRTIGGFFFVAVFVAIVAGLVWLFLR
jgi:hypothetical protein